MSTIKSIGIIGYTDCSEQDTITPTEIFKGAAMVVNENKETLKVELVSLDNNPIKMQMGTQVIPDSILDEKSLFDILYIPGGVGSGVMTKNKKMLDLIKKHYDAGKVVAANCSGVGILFRAGILGNNPVTSISSLVRRLRELGANVPQPRNMWIGLPEQRLWTTVGTSGVNGSSVALVSHYLGNEVGQSVSMMFDTLGAIGNTIYELKGPEYYFHPKLEAKFQDIWEMKLLP